MSGAWQTYGTVALHTLIIYVYLIVLVRLFGRRQLGQLTVIDLLVLILLGSTVETAMINGNTAIRAGLISAATLFIANWILSKFLRRSRRFSHFAGSEPSLLVHDGKFIQENLKRCGLTEADVLEALRGRECAELATVKSAVLEVDGTVNIIRK